MLNNGFKRMPSFQKSIIEVKCSGHSQFLINMKAKKKELSEDLRQRLVCAHNEVKGYKATSKQYDVTVVT